MPRMTKDDDPEAYIEAFEQMATQTGLDRSQWGHQLGALVIDEAQAAYRALSREEAQDYEAVKAAILYRLEISPESYRQAFKARKSRVVREEWERPMGLGISAEEYRRDLQDRIQKAQRIARHNVREAQERQETHYNRRVKHRTFQSSDQVLVSIPTTASKQLAMWQGPFTVIRQVGPVDYEVSKPGHLWEQQVYHVNHLKEWKTPQAWIAQEKAGEGDLGPLCPGLGRTILEEAVHLSDELDNHQ
ncbi:hypothetical protein Y1Q_0007903 [Alligator mississippiensis]|uniref:Integrase p58-like C-terminal domain-containing protein n=1 Tax=Alligator mississippiensis TaxID=8496 RepID=A0A151NF76_ALLMI|nr:hypothetical protein Y1Q_0007903 [Alligator mississippiensis]